MIDTTFSEIIRNYAQAVQSIGTVVAVIIGGIWAYFRFIRQREHSQRIEFLVDIEFVGLQDDQWLIEALAFIENKGLVNQIIKDLSFTLRYVDSDDRISDGDKEINFQANISRELKKGVWVPESWEATFIEPGLKTRYGYVASVPSEASFVLIHGRFSYQDEKEFHTAKKLVKVPDKNEFIVKSVSEKK